MAVCMCCAGLSGKLSTQAHSTVSLLHSRVWRYTQGRITTQNSAACDLCFDCLQLRSIIRVWRQEGYAAGICCAFVLLQQQPGCCGTAVQPAISSTSISF
jgi:hypothetical protein